jgi:hypothetical protein
MMRKDGEAHLSEQKVFFPAISPRAVASQWIASASVIVNVRKL